MTEIQTKEAPRTGPESPEGPRWFVTGCPEMSFTVKPAETVEVAGKERQRKAVRIHFKRQAKPQRFIGTGFLGRGGGIHMPGETDRNQPHAWGLIRIPAKGDKLSDEDRENIAWLREHEYYRSTIQDNAAEVNMQLKLKELDWDPRTSSGELGGVHRPGEAPEPEGDTVAAPDDASGRHPRARVGLRAR